MNKYLNYVSYLIICLLGFFLFTENYQTLLPHRLIHLRYGDDLMFHNYLSKQYDFYVKHSFIEYLTFLKPVFAYSSLYWFINFIVFYLFSFFDDNTLLTLAPFIVSLVFLLAALYFIYRIYLLYFSKRPTAVIALIICIFIPMITHSAVRFHNYSMTLFFSSLLFFCIKKWEMLTYKRLILIALTSSILISIKLNGVFIGIACLGLLFEKKSFVKLNLRFSFFLFFSVFIISYLFFIQPSFLWNLLTANFTYLKNPTLEYIEMINEALRKGDVNFLQNIYSLKDHYLSGSLFLLYSTGFTIWFIKEPKKRIEIGMIALCLFFWSFFLILTSKVWHGPTYLVGICFLLPLSIHGFELIQKKSFRLSLISMTILFSAYHFTNNYTLMHKRDLYIARDSNNYKILEIDQDLFLEKFPEPDNYQSNLRISCFVYSFCPWIIPKLPFELSIVYSPLTDLLSNSDYLFFNKQPWPDQTKYLFNSFEQEFMNNFIKDQRIGDVNYEIIYESQYNMVYKRK